MNNKSGNVINNNLANFIFVFLKQMFATSQQTVSAIPNQNSALSTIKNFYIFKKLQVKNMNDIIGNHFFMSENL
jgi:hypothetical protein